MTASPKRKQSSRAGSKSAESLMMWTPTLDPCRGDFTTNGTSKFGLAGGNDVPPTGGDTMLIKRSLTEYLIECKLTTRYSLTGIGDALPFEDFLDLTIFAKGAMNHVVGEVDRLRQRKIQILDVDLLDDGAQERSARATAAPERSDTSRSGPGPPRRTATFFLSECQSCVNANDLHFGLEIDATLARGGGLDLFIRVRISSAVAPPSLTMKLPCTSETRALPTVKFLKPSSSISFPAGVWSGFLKMQPALAATGWDSRRFCSATAIRASISWGSAGVPRSVAERA